MTSLLVDHYLEQAEIAAQTVELWCKDFADHIEELDEIIRKSGEKSDVVVPVSGLNLAGLLDVARKSVLAVEEARAHHNMGRKSQAVRSVGRGDDLDFGDKPSA